MDLIEVVNTIAGLMPVLGFPTGGFHPVLIAGISPDYIDVFPWMAPLLWDLDRPWQIIRTAEIATLAHITGIVKLAELRRIKAISGRVISEMNFPTTKIGAENEVIELGVRKVGQGVGKPNIQSKWYRIQLGTGFYRIEMGAGFIAAGFSEGMGVLPELEHQVSLSGLGLLLIRCSINGDGGGTQS